MTTEAQAAQATQEKEVKKGKSLFMNLDKLFRIPPTPYRAKSDSDRKIVVEHRLGRKTVSYTREALMRRTGLEKEWKDRVSRIEKRISSTKELNDLMDSMWATQKTTLHNMIRGYKGFMKKVYAHQGGIVRATFVPVDDQGTSAFYIQAIVDQKTKALLAGDPDDLALWNEVTAVREKPHADAFDEAMESSKALMKLPGVNKDIQHRMKLLLSGDFPISVNRLLGGPEEKE